MSTLPYHPGVFATLAATSLGEELWSFLNEEESRIRMSTASDLGRPAVEAVEEQLLKRFGAAVLEGRVKQMIGHMTKQIMEQDGYIHDGHDVKITGGAPFSRGSRYKRPDSRTYHVWKLATDPYAFVLTADDSGNALPEPEEGAEWTHWRRLEGDLRATVLLGIQDIALVRADIASKGYHRHQRARMLRAPKS
ncbi:hypothetical protein [Cupriavidus pinatubonensis]|uniref:hypothetical protein n=1 Tax=Cupriavidus pinatubonensis TaxID=248026 RepID=UPI00366B79E3